MCSIIGLVANSFCIFNILWLTYVLCFQHPPACLTLQCKWIHKKSHIWTAEKDIFMTDNRSCTHNLSSCEIKAWKNSGLNGIPAHDLCDTGAVLYHLNYQANLELVPLWARSIPVEGKECKWIHERSINRRLSEISSDEAVFKEAATPYQEALYKNGYTYKLEFKPPQTASPPRRNRSRVIIWFNPPYNRNIKSNIGRNFLCLVDKCFPAGHKLRKIFNRNTLKLSYSCMPNVQQIINGRN